MGLGSLLTDGAGSPMNYDDGGAGSLEFLLTAALMVPFWPALALAGALGMDEAETGLAAAMIVMTFVLTLTVERLGTHFIRTRSGPTGSRGSEAPPGGLQ